MEIRITIQVLLLSLFCTSFAFSAKSHWGEEMVRMDDVAAVLGSLTKTGSDGAFVIFLMPSTSIIDGYDANIQISIEDGDMDFDWYC